MDLGLDGERLPLAARMRPRALDEFVGQEHILAPGRLLRRAIEADQLRSIILSGPPGTGKTTLARVIAEHTESQFLSVNAVLSGVKDLREAIERAKTFRDSHNRRTILFVDEVHRWNRSQQDALLPWVEEGLFILIGATTENPFFEVNRALLSRSRVFLLTPLGEEHLEAVLAGALADRERGYGRYTVTLTDDAREHLIRTASGDARTLLNALELAVETNHSGFPPPPGETIAVDLAVAEESIQQRAVLYDKDGDYHFDTISALIKSVRGSDADAALYWLAKMITAGEDPRYILRRLLILAAEDIGLADPHAVSVVLSCAQAFDRIGMPEGQFHLSQATLYLANTLKSNSTLAYFDAVEAVKRGMNDEVPVHLRDAHRDGEDLGHGKGYLYPHAYRDHWVAQQYLPAAIQGRTFYSPGELGWEGIQAERLENRRRIQLAAIREEESTHWSVAPKRGVDSWIHRADGAMVDELARLRDELLGRLDVKATDRVLLTGDAVQFLVWESLRRAHGGLTAVWTDAAAAQTLRHTLKERESDVDAPQIYTVDSAGHVPENDGPLHAGPFERIVCRDYGHGDPGTLVSDLLSLLTPDGRIVISDIEPHGGTRPSSILSLSDDDRATLRDAERVAYPSRVEMWSSLADRYAAKGALDVSVETIQTTLFRTVRGGHMERWLEASAPVGRALDRNADRSAVERIRSAARQWKEREVHWQRTHLAITITRGDHHPS